MADLSSLAPDPMSEEFNVTGIEHNGSSFIVIASSASTGIMHNMSVYSHLMIIVAIYTVNVLPFPYALIYQLSLCCCLCCVGLLEL